MAGIERIQIISEWNDWRIKMSRELAPAADTILFQSWADLEMPLKPGVEIVRCTKADAVSRYDWREGVDCILHFADGTKATMQEKYLTFAVSTATFEERKEPHTRPGAWYTCTAQYYWVGYARKYKDNEPPVCEFQDWILIDFPQLQRLSKTTELPWRHRQNQRDGCLNVFRFLNFDEIPPAVVVARHQEPHRQLTLDGMTPAERFGAIVGGW